MKTPNFYLKFAFKFQIVGSVLSSFEIPTPTFHTSSIRQRQKTLTSKSSRFIFSRELLRPEKILEKVSQLHE